MPKHQNLSISRHYIMVFCEIKKIGTLFLKLARFERGLNFLVSIEHYCINAQL